MKYTCTKTPSMFRKCDNIFLLCNVTHLRLGLGKLFMLGIHETWTFFPPNQKELKTKIEPAFSLILYLCSFLFMIQYDGRKMDRHFEKKLIWELLLKIDYFSKTSSFSQCRLKDVNLDKTDKSTIVHCCQYCQSVENCILS